MYKKTVKNSFAKKKPLTHIKPALKGRGKPYGVPSADGLPAPRDVYQTPEIRKVYSVLKLRPAGESTKAMLATPLGRYLIEGHWENVKKMLSEMKHTLRNEAEVTKFLEKTVKTPQQRFVILHEATGHAPLTANGFTEYLTLIKELFPNIYTHAYHDKSPAQVTKACEMQMKSLSMHSKSRGRSD